MSPAPSTLALPDWPSLRARSHPHHPAIESHDGVLTYGALEGSVAGLAGPIKAGADVDGRPVAVLAGNSAAFACLVHAIPRAGGVFMPLNARLTPNELAWQLRDSRAALLIADAGEHGRARTAAATAGVPLASIADLEGGGAALPGSGTVDPARPHSVIYTSGTTGHPKGAVLTHGNFYWSAVGSALNLGVDPADRWLACMPLFHVGGLSILLRSAIYGTTAVIHDRFDEHAADAALRNESITLLSVVSTMLRRVLEVDGRPYPPSVRAVLVGGGPAPPELLEAARDRGLPVLQTYGLTEAASQVTTLAAEDALRKLGASGRPLASSLISIERDGTEAPAGAAGEILVSGPTTSPGYLGRPRLDEDGWLRTGDIGVLDDEGYLTVLDRRDDLIVSGGENVYPGEVEAVLAGHPAVDECAIVGLRDPHWGQVVVAIVVPAAGAEADGDALARYLRDRLAGYKIPRRFERWDGDLPRTASGKLQRHVVRRRLMEGAGHEGEEPPAG